MSLNDGPPTTWSSRQPVSLALRSALKASQSASSGSLCFEIHSGNIVISRTTLIAALSICVFLVLVSVAAVVALLYREWSRRKEAQAAKKWGRKSHYIKRVSQMRKEVDDTYSRQYSGCLAHEPENPEMGSDSPVEMMFAEPREVPAIPARSIERDGNRHKRKSGVESLFFDQRAGLWFPKTSQPAAGQSLR